MRWIEKVRARDVIADDVDKANKQHYEVRSHRGPYSLKQLTLYTSGVH
jgi:hypothetical protein